MVTPRPYQADAFSAIVRLFDRGVPSSLLVLPTGCGKTVTFGLAAKYVIEDLGGRALVLAHRGELIDQAVNAMIALEMDPLVERADEHACPVFTLGSHKGGQSHMFGDLVKHPNLVVASVQTLQAKRLRSWPEGYFDLVICDEAHHAAADSYRRVVGHLKPKYYLGVTATWDRGDKKPIVGPGQVFEELAYEYSITEAVQSGYLARPWYELIECDVDLGKIRTTAGDLNAGDLESAIKPHVEELCNLALARVKDRKTIVFTPDVGSADAVASAFRSLGVTAMSVSGKDDDRKDIVSAFRNGEYQLLANCQLLTEGFDAPFVDCILMMRPTKSRALFAQMAGRGTRIYPGKQDCLILGYNWKTFNHKLVHPVELFDGPGLDPLDVEGAKALVDSGEEKDLDRALKRAKSERAERERLRLEIEEKKRKVKSYKFDPLAVDGGSLDAPVFGEDSAGLVARGSARQVAALERFGFKGSETVEWSRARCSAVLDKMVSRAREGLSTKKQIELLRKLGYADGASLTLPDASAMIDELLRGKNARAAV